MTRTTAFADRAEAVTLGFRGRAAGLTVGWSESKGGGSWAVTLTGDAGTIETVIESVDPLLSDRWWDRWNSGRTSGGPPTGRLSWVR